MKKLYEKSQLWFSLVWIIAYVVITSVADGLSESLGIAKALTLVVHIIMSLSAFIFIKKNNLLSEYGFCKTPFKASKYLFYIPLVILVSVNFWFGIRINMPVTETIFYIGSMICVGFLEELIFRGFLFKAMAKDNLKVAVAVSSITFGIGHIVNLVNGSGALLVATICQIFYAIAVGYLFVIIFHRGRSLFPCIAAHSLVNATSAFTNETAMGDAVNIFTSVIICVVAISYSLILRKTLREDKKI
ncbi:MAG: CPBP family intramembrane metalloprotease [Ruminococcaceae bacterium]|nr:CPBP family intramembrane metalloprotease [Oscillospiraceae bacterium]